ncbi:hypothetical protein FG167_09220 [Lacinutrix sp. WUR7]|uniref:hypothetical protein n=1 Tax=Lacinutrix sp. WUR7 TaxID=2653681 RepID=UPI00193E90AF|nr:hypothetical protein [Lacinutrix sp. WUR7]QRM89411.1 hypothetical protein FG167_09220 [Lacinutrix sp. WUR7]
MKKLLIIALALVTIQVSAQEKMERKHKGADFSPQEMAELRTKKMTLDLDLTAAQQKEIGAINLENAIARKAKMEARKDRKKSEEKPSKEEMLKMKNEHLDAQIANKKKMKSILNADQYAKWEKQGDKRNHKEGKRKGKKGERDSKPSKE